MSTFQQQFPTRQAYKKLNKQYRNTSSNVHCRSSPGLYKNQVTSVQINHYWLNCVSVLGEKNNVSAQRPCNDSLNNCSLTLGRRVEDCFGSIRKMPSRHRAASMLPLHLQVLIISITELLASSKCIQKGIKMFYLALTVVFGKRVGSRELVGDTQVTMMLEREVPHSVRERIWTQMKFACH